MRKTNAGKKKKRKFRILLDAAFANTSSFPFLARKTNVAHVVHTYHLSPACSDEDIYQLAIREDRFVLTINYKDFRKMVKKNKPGIIGIESQLTNKEIDHLVSRFLSGKDPDEWRGKAIKISQSNTQ